MSYASHLKHGIMEKRTTSEKLRVLSVYVPDNVYVSVLGSQVERRRPIGVAGVPLLGLQQSSTHVTGQQQLHHLHMARTI